MLISEKNTLREKIIMLDIFADFTMKFLSSVVKKNTILKKYKFSGR